MFLEKVQLEHVPESHRIYAAFFRDITNAAFLRSQLLDRNADFEYAFIDASSILSRNHVLAAVFRAVATQADGALRTPNVHSEIVCCLGVSNNIAEAYRRYGIAADSKNIIIVKVLFPAQSNPDLPSADGVWAHLQQHVEGTPVQFTDENIEECTDMAKVKKYYKLSGVPALGNQGDEEKRKRETELMVLGAMALRGV